MDPLNVIKIGGNIIDDTTKLAAFIQAFAGLKGHKILVHGGGKLATSLAQQMGVEQQLVEGRRITDAETLKIVTMVYAGHINKTIVAQLQGAGCNAIGLTGADGNVILAHQRAKGTIDYGFAGDIDAVNKEWIDGLLQHQSSLVFSPITHDGKGQLLNSNADTVAQEIARAMSGLYEVQLIYCFEKKGVLSDPANEEAVIPRIDPASYAALKSEKVITMGMIPKLDNAFAALQAGVKNVIIGDAAELDQLIHQQAGTTITHAS